MKHIFFLTLKTFSATGGIEKVCRLLGKAIYEIIAPATGTLQVKSMHDHTADANNNLYFPKECFSGNGGNKILFILQAVKQGRKKDTVILSHINLLLAGWLIKKLSPSTKLILLTHGIEVWQPLKKRQQMMLKSCNEIIAVSNYTSIKMQELHGVPAAKCKVLNNCLDPFLPVPHSSENKETLLQKFEFNKEDIILFMLSRLAQTERAKGYDKVIKAMASIQKNNGRRLRYLIAGKYTADEKNFIETLAIAEGIPAQVVLAGYIPDNEMADYFNLASIYIMPSKKEGFGIVFTEAMYYGLPVIAGNADGSVDALLNGKLGMLVNPESVEEIKAALEKMIANPTSYSPDRELLMQNFSFESYKRNLEVALNLKSFPILELRN